jgi:prolyl-tRNA synthetase
VLYDDREEKSAGEKFADADLIGIPWRVVVSERALEKKSIEVKRRDGQVPILLKLSQLGAFIKKEFLMRR